MAKQNPTGLWLAILVLVLALCGIGWFVARSRAPVPPLNDEPPFVSESLSPEQVLSLTTQARAAVGFLENERLVDAESSLAELTTDVPDEPIAVRNLAIAKLLLLEGGKGDSEATQTVLKQLEGVEPKEPSTWWLAARANLKLAETSADEQVRQSFTSRAIEQLRRAAELAPRSPLFAFQLYWHSRFDADESKVQAGRQALERAYQLAPDNLFVLTEYLASQVETKDPAILQTIDRAKAKLGPLAQPIERRTRINVLRMLDQAAEAAKTEDWMLVRRNLIPLSGPVRSEEITQSDTRRIDINPLEFVVHDFSDRFREQNPLIEPPAPLVEFQFRAEDYPGAADIQDALDARVVDMDLDDKPDLLLLREGQLEAYQLDARGQIGASFLSLKLPEGMTRLLVADLDQDTLAAPVAGGRAAPVAPAASPGSESSTTDAASQSCFRADGDVVVYGPGGMLVLRNQLASDGKTRTLELVEQEAALEATLPVHGATLGDLDHDGDLDVVASTEKGIRLRSNRGQLLFEDISQYSTLPPADQRFSSISIVDWDRDVDIDVFLAGKDAAQAGYLESLRHGEFHWRPLPEEFGTLAQSAAIQPLEADGYPSWDLVAADESGVNLVLTRTIPADSVQVVDQRLISDRPFDQLLVADFDNSGFPDVFTWSGDSIAVLRDEEKGRFNVVPQAVTNWKHAIQSVDAADVDGDGDLDLAVVADRRLFLLVNDGGHANRYLTLHAHGDEDNKSGRVNHWAIGSLVELKAGGMYQARVITGATTHFGLGQTAEPDLVRILWTQGIPQAIVQPKVNQEICEPMILKGSCPYVYTWTGERFEFFTDLLWAAPIGLQLADGVLAPDRPGEYLLVPGDRLREKDGHYELRITEELWEAGYFDQVELLAVDHPVGTQVFSNEKVGPPEIAEFKIHTVRQPRPLAAAHNHRGRDLLPQLKELDHDYAQAFDRTLRQGLAEECFMELDLGRLENPKHVTLFLTGWIRPTDTSLNVALSHDPSLDAPRPPSLSIVDAQGQWHEVLPFMGFPGGKPKTIAVDLSGIFLTPDYRVRIQSSAELYWDEIFFTVDEEPVHYDLQPLSLASADLHARGFSQLTLGPRSQPEQFDYERVDRQPRWPPMRGRFTRYGDVQELVTKVDAKLVVMSAGDEMTLRFTPTAAPLRHGWVRDFILHNVGWDKDADLNTVHGQTVEPMPYVGMPSYPYSEPGPLAEESYRQYLRTYQTREVPASAFWGTLSTGGSSGGIGATGFAGFASEN